MKPVDPSLREFKLTFSDGEELELRYTWPAIAQIERWLGKPWYLWDPTSHNTIPALAAGGLLWHDSKVTPEAIAEKLDPRRWGEYRQLLDDAITYAHTGKTRAEREAEEMAKRKKAEEEAGSEGEDAPAGP